MFSSGHSTAPTSSAGHSTAPTMTPSESDSPYIYVNVVSSEVTMGEQRRLCIPGWQQMTIDDLQIEITLKATQYINVERGMVANG